MQDKGKKIYSLFKFLNNKFGERIPLKLRFFYELDALSSEDLEVRGDLNLENYPNKYLPDGLAIMGEFSVKNSKLEVIPSGLYVQKAFKVDNTNISGFPQDLDVRSHIYASGTKIEELTDREFNGALIIDNTPIKVLRNVKIKGDLGVTRCKNLEVIEDVTIKNILDLNYSSVVTLKNVTVDSIFAEGTKLANFENVKINGTLYFSYSDLSKKYTSDQIRQMIKDGGGYIRGHVVTQDSI